MTACPWRESTLYSLLAAQALRASLKLVTRNEKDFAFPGLDAIDPWND